MLNVERPLSTVTKLAKSGSQVRKKIRRQHGFFGRLIDRKFGGPSAKPGTQSPRVVDWNLPCQESGTDPGQHIARSARRQARGPGRIVGHRLTRLTKECPRAFEKQADRKLGGEFLDDLDATFASSRPESRHLTWMRCEQTGASTLVKRTDRSRQG